MTVYNITSVFDPNTLRTTIRVHTEEVQVHETLIATHTKLGNANAIARQEATKLQRARKRYALLIYVKPKMRLHTATRITTSYAEVVQAKKEIDRVLKTKLELTTRAELSELSHCMQQASNALDEARKFLAALPIPNTGS